LACKLNDSWPFLHSSGLNAASCPFAEDIRYHYNQLSPEVRQRGPVQIYAHSVVTDTTYLVECVPSPFS
jgi:hypothetical protein